MQNRYTLKLLPQAERDLDEIYAYIAYELQNNAADVKLMDEIELTLIGLEDFPLRCPFSDIDELKRDGYRKCVIKNFIALYTVDEEQKLVRIAKIF